MVYRYYCRDCKGPELLPVNKEEPDQKCFFCGGALIKGAKNKCGCLYVYYKNNRVQITKSDNSPARSFEPNEEAIAPCGHSVCVGKRLYGLRDTGAESMECQFADELS